MPNYLHDDNHNKVEGYTKEEILSILEQIIEEQSLAGITADSGFITKIKNVVDNKTYKIGFCTQAQYTAMEQGGTLEEDCIYYITDDSTMDDIMSALDEFQDTLDDFQDVIDAVCTKLSSNSFIKKTTLSNPSFSALYTAINTNKEKIDRIELTPTISITISYDQIGITGSNGGTASISNLSDSIELTSNSKIILYPTYQDNSVLEFKGKYYDLDIEINSTIDLKYHPLSSAEKVSSLLGIYQNTSATIKSGMYNSSTYFGFNVNIYTREILSFQEEE